MTDDRIADISKDQKTFTVFYCELQTWGPHRCKSKIVTEDNEIDSHERYCLYIIIILPLDCFLLFADKQDNTQRLFKILECLRNICFT